MDDLSRDWSTVGPMESLLCKQKPLKTEFLFDKKCLAAIKTLPDNKTVEQINKKHLTLLIFIQPLIYPTNNKAIQEIFQLLDELDDHNVRIVFVFSERSSVVHNILVKYNLNDKVTFVCDHQLIFFDKFHVPNRYISEAESSQRDTHIFFLKNNKLELTMKYNEYLPIEEIKEQLHFGQYLKNNLKTKQKDFIFNYSLIYKELDIKKKGWSPNFVANSSSSGNSLKTPKFKLKQMKTESQKSQKLTSGFGPSSPISSPSMNKSITSRSYESKKSDTFSEELIDLDEDDKDIFQGMDTADFFCRKKSEDGLIIPKRKSSFLQFNFGKERSSSMRFSGNKIERKSSLGDSFSFKKLSLQAQRFSSFSEPSTEKFEEDDNSFLSRQISPWKLRKSRKNSFQLLSFKSKKKTTKRISNPRQSLELFDILENDFRRAYLYHFTQKEYSVENIKFWEDVRDFKSIDDTEERLDKAEYIHETYLTADAEYEINTSRTLLLHAKKTLRECLETNECESTIFDRLLFDIEANVLHDTFTRFKWSEIYQTMLEE